MEVWRCGEMEGGLEKKEIGGDGVMRGINDTHFRTYRSIGRNNRT